MCKLSAKPTVKLRQCKRPLRQRKEKFNNIGTRRPVLREVLQFRISTSRMNWSTTEGRTGESSTWTSLKRWVVELFGRRGDLKRWVRFLIEKAADLNWLVIGGLLYWAFLFCKGSLDRAMICRMTCPMKSYWRGRVSAVNLLVLTSLNQLLFIL